MRNFILFSMCFFIGRVIFAFPMAANINTVVPQSKEAFRGLREFKTVLPGVLYRGGGPGGAKPMNQAQLESLCKEGFSGAGYLYPTGMNGRKSLSCQTSNGQTNSIDYDVYGFRGREDRYKALKAVHEIILKRQGPMFMHCWNGWHASGEIAAISLIQFCGWSGAEAGEYWKANVGDQSNLPKYQSIWQKHVGTFEAFPDLKIASEDQKRICPAR